MKKLKNGKEILIIVAVLTSIAIASGLLLGVMNKLTYVDQTQALIDKIGELYDSPITPLEIDDYNNIEDTEILNAFIADDGAYIVESKSDKAYSSDGLKLIVIIKEGKIVAINGKGNSETPGLGTKALDDNYLNNYIGIDYDYFSESSSYETDNDTGINIEWGLTTDTDDDSSATPTASTEIEAISGATKSSNGVKYAVQAALAFYEYMEASNE